ncbi:MAG: NUDIX hydrolase [Chloroflexi bacterium]|nr:NUDIX hydrolase [Chloroflexota bacterium]
MNASLVAPRHIVAASAMVRNDKGQILLVRTHRRGWEIPGGQIEIGESLIDGLKREVLEESGVQVEIGRLAVLRSNLTSSIVIFCFEARYLGGQLRPSDETPQVQWVSPERALEMISHPAILQSFQDLMAGAPDVIYRAYYAHPYRLVESHAPH